MVTSTVFPVVPPIGIKVSNRGIGKMTDWAEAKGSRAIPTHEPTINSEASQAVAGGDCIGLGNMLTSRSFDNGILRLEQSYQWHGCWS
jgi:hypothetical protein